jgi:hypothetical protein
MERPLVGGDDRCSRAEGGERDKRDQVGHDPPDVTAGAAGTFWTGREVGGVSVPPCPLGGSASRTAVVALPEVEPTAVPLVFEVERPENPSAATADKMIVSTTDAAAVTRVTRTADRMPLALTRPRSDR